MIILYIYIYFESHIILNTTTLSLNFSDTIHILFERLINLITTTHIKTALRTKEKEKNLKQGERETNIYTHTHTT